MTTTTIERMPVLGRRAHDGRRSGALLDRATLVDAYSEHRGAAYRVAFRLLGERPAAEDAVQDAFLKFWTGNVAFDPSRGSMRGLLLTMARHTSIDFIRRRAARSRTESAYCTDDVRTTEGPEPATERREDRSNVRGALLNLPADQRSVIELCYFSGLTSRQIATEMGIPVGTVKSRRRLGMRKLALALGEER